MRRREKIGQMRGHRRDKLELEHVKSRLTTVYGNTYMHTYVTA